MTLRVDNDRPGSGYTEVRPENWESRDVNACAGTYRYLSRLVGDGSRRGGAVWQPSVPRDGWYRVELSYRATANRSSAARYTVTGDDGAERTLVEDQRNGDACVRRDAGEVFCRVGGRCRLTLDSQDGQSASADETVFTLVRCEGAPEPPQPPMPPMGPCAGIAATPGFEVCEESEGRCAGVFTNGAGCAAFCAAAGMTCVARTGGEPGCLAEPQSPIPCEAENGHASDWCVCQAPPSPPPLPTLDAQLEDAAVLDASPRDGTPPDRMDTGPSSSSDVGPDSQADAGPGTRNPIPLGDASEGPAASPEGTERPQYSGACHVAPGTLPTSDAWPVLMGLFWGAGRMYRTRRSLRREVTRSS